MSHSRKTTYQEQPVPQMERRNFFDNVPEETYCRGCKQNFPSWRELYVHKYQSPKHIVCIVCGSDFKTQEGYKRHHDQAHAYQQDLKCPACNDVFGRVGAFMNHLELKKCPVLNKAREAKEKEAAKMRNQARFDQIREAGIWGSLYEPNPNIPTVQHTTPSHCIDSEQDSLSASVQSPIIPTKAQAPLVPVTIEESADISKNGDEDLIDLTLNSVWEGHTTTHQDLLSLDSSALYKGQSSSKAPILGHHQEKTVVINSSPWVTGITAQQTTNKNQLPPQLADSSQLFETHHNSLCQMRKDIPIPASQSPCNLTSLHDETVNECSDDLSNPRMVSKNAKKGQLSHEYAENPVWDELTSGQTSKPTLWSNKLFPDARPALAPPPQNWTHPIDSNGMRFSDHDPDSPDFHVGKYYIDIINKFKCPHRGCSKSFSSSDSFVHHLRSSAHRDVEKLQCRSCLKYFVSTSALAQHVESQSVKCHVRNETNFDNYIDDITRNIVALKGLHKDDTNAYEIQVLDGEKAGAMNEAAKRKKQNEVINKSDGYWHEKAGDIEW